MDLPCKGSSFSVVPLVSDLFHLLHLLNICLIPPLQYQNQPASRINKRINQVKLTNEQLALISSFVY